MGFLLFLFAIVSFSVILLCKFEIIFVRWTTFFLITQLSGLFCLKKGLFWYDFLKRNDMRIVWRPRPLTFMALSRLNGVPLRFGVNFLILNSLDIKCSLLFLYSLWSYWILYLFNIGLYPVPFKRPLPKLYWLLCFDRCFAHLIILWAILLYVQDLTNLLRFLLEIQCKHRTHILPKYKILFLCILSNLLLFLWEILLLNLPQSIWIEQYMHISLYLLH